MCPGLWILNEKNRSLHCICLDVATVLAESMKIEILIPILTLMLTGYIPSDLRVLQQGSARSDSALLQTKLHIYIYAHSSKDPTKKVYLKIRPHAQARE